MAWATDEVHLSTPKGEHPPVFNGSKGGLVVVMGGEHKPHFFFSSRHDLLRVDVVRDGGIDFF